MRFTGTGLVLGGVAIGVFAAIGYLLTDPEARTIPTLMLVVAAVSAAAGAAALAFGGRGYVVSKNPSVHN